MSIDDLKQLLCNRRLTIDFDSCEQDFCHGLRLVLTDLDTGEMWLLAVEPDMVALPDECLLFYSLQRLETTLPEPEHLILDLRTKLEPDYQCGETPSFFS